MVWTVLSLGAGVSGQAEPTTTAAAAFSEQEIELMNGVLQEDLFIISISRLALERSDNDEVRGVARTLITAHTQVTAALMALARDEGVVLDGNSPTQLTPERQRAIDQLQAVEGEAFDERYLSQQTRVHNTAVEMLEQLPEMVDHPSMQFFVNAADTLMNQHLDMVQNMSR